MIRAIRGACDCREVFRRFWPSNFRERGLSRCPFHEDKTPSLQIEKDHAYCFGACKTSRDAIDLFERGTNCTKAEALKLLAQELGIDNGNNGNTLPTTKHGGKPNDFRSRYRYLLNTPLPDEALAYLTDKRKISAPTVQRLLKARMVAWSAKKQSLVFPVHSFNEEDLLGLQYIPIDGSGKKFAGGSKTDNGFFRVGSQGPVDFSVVCESILDALSVVDSMPYAEAYSIFSSSGWKKIESLRHLGPILFFDRDEAGQGATAKSVEQCGPIRAVDWTKAPEGMKDANEILQAGRSDLISRLVKNSPLISACDIQSGESKGATEKGNDSRPKFSRDELLQRIESTSDFDELTGPIASDVTGSGLSESSILNLRKLIAKKAKVSVSSLIADAKGFENVEATREFLHLQAAREVIASFGAGNFLHSLNTCWAWEGSGVWRKMDDREIKQRIHQISEGDELTQNVVNSVFDMVKTEAFRPGHEFDVDRRSINVLNGELHWNGNLWELRPHQKQSYRTTQLPVAYDAEATCPRFVQFLDEVFRDDSDKHEKARIVCEFMGYSLLSSCEFEKFILLIGPGANGKSVLMDTMAGLVGREHVCAVQPSQFENRFQRAHLHGKLVNLVTEIAEGHEIADAQLKAIVSGELTTAEHKHQKPFDFRPFATCWFGTNHMPHTRDFSDALFRRAIILTFNHTFREEEQDKHLKEKLKLELPGILNLGLLALAGVFRRGAFTTSASCEEAKSQWRVNCDQVAQFVEDCCMLGPELLSTSYEIYSAYEAWCKDGRIKRTLNRKNFTIRLKRLGAEDYKGTGGTRMLAGIEKRQEWR